MRVIETLTTERVIPLGTNSSPAGGIDTVIETLTTERVIPLGTNSSPAEVSVRNTDY